ncbi:MAG: FlgD immunoglobulin-like domain containing protein [Candidatus Edwardsbacteria bacterium]|nr:FlgD immunoglobulin-like domain containing protein [Candidatus Edwardsbacteria bacterium]
MQGFSLVAAGNGPTDSADKTFTTSAAVKSGSFSGAGTETPGSQSSFRAAPNPFRQSTVFSFNAGRADRATLPVCNVAGQKVRTLVNGYQSTGAHSVTWDGRNETGVRAAEGVFIYHLVSADGSVAGRMNLLK